jgi:hypothetical protein
MKNKMIKSLFMMVPIFMMLFPTEILIAQNFDYTYTNSDGITEYLENPFNIIAPKYIEIKSTSKNELNPIFAFYFNMFYRDGDAKVSKIVDKNTIYSDSYYCPKDSNHLIKNLFKGNCEICDAKIKFRPRIEYQFYKESEDSKGHHFKEYEIEYNFIPEKNVFVAAIKYNKIKWGDSYETSITYVAFHPYLGPLNIEVIKDYKNMLYSFDNNSFSRRLQAINDSINTIKLNKIDEILNSKIKKKEKKSLIESIEFEHLNKTKYVENNLEKEYLLNMNLHKLFNWNFVIHLNESKSKEIINNSYVTLGDGNYSFSIEGENIKYNPQYIITLGENQISRKYGPNDPIDKKKISYPLKFDYIHNSTNDSENTSNKYLLGSAFMFKTSKYIKRIKTSDNQFIEVENQSPEPSRNLLKDNNTTEAYFVDELHYQLFILSRYGHPVFKVPGGYYKNIKNLGDNKFEAIQVSSNNKIKLTLSNDANSISDMIKLVR